MINVNKLLQKITKTVSQSKKTHQNSTALLKKIQKEYKGAVRKNERIQNKLDREALTTVQRLDRLILSFIKATE